MNLIPSFLITKTYSAGIAMFQQLCYVENIFFTYHKFKLTVKVKEHDKKYEIIFLNNCQKNANEKLLIEMNFYLVKYGYYQ